MTEEIKNFVENFNRQVQWENEIINSIGKKNIPQDIIKNFFTTDIITEDGYDLENAKLYEYGKNDSWAGRLELQAFSNITYRTTYFWLRPENYTEEEYKANRIEEIKKEVNKKLNELYEKIKDLTSEYKKYNKLNKKIN